jgi:NADPH:quinone reductase-like Zn-dependent oxidoreductase
MQPSAKTLTELSGLFDAGIIRTVVTKTYPLAQAAEAWKSQMAGHTRGKVVLTVAG